jgi:hypothetical protein
MWSKIEAQNVSFALSSNAEKITQGQYRTYMGDYFELNFMVLNGVGQNFVPPSLSDFIVKSGPNPYSMEQINNGVRTSKYGYTYTLQARKTGVFNIKFAKISVQGKEYYTQTVQIEVSKSENTGKKGSASPIVLRTKTDKIDYYVGEQINLTYQLLTNTNIQDYEVTQRPELKDFLVQEIQKTENEATTTRYKGVSYKSFDLEKKILYAQKSGSITIDPIAANLVVATQERVMNGFTMPSSDMVSAASEPITLNIKDLPPSPNPDFSGGIGTWEMNLEANKNELSTGETLLLQLTLTGKGDPKRIILPKLKTSDSLEVYDPKVIEESYSLNEDNEPISIKKVEYLIVPKYAGNYSVQPILNYFDTESQNYESVKTAPFAFSASGGTINVIEDKKENTTPSKSITWKKYITYGTAFLFSGLLLFGLLRFFYKKKKKKPILVEKETTNTVEKIVKPSAIQVVEDTPTKGYWSEAIVAKANHDYTNFYKNIQNAVFEKINQSFQIPENGISENNIAEKLANTSISEVQIQDLVYVLRTCTIARYGGADKADEADTVFDKARNFLECRF